MKYLVLTLTLFVASYVSADGASGENQIGSPQKMIVRVPVADVRAEPKDATGGYEHDPLAETQVLEGEPVLVLEKRGRWVRIECPQQPEFTHHSRWEGYPGWVRARALTKDSSRETQLKKPEASQNEIRGKILEFARLHLGTRYLWGGRSVHEPRYRKTATGVDCSGLVNWAYRQVGWIVPRDSHEQFMKSRAVAPKALNVADLIFLAPADKPEKIVHVALYAGNDELLEAPQTDDAVRIISFEERFGKSLAAMKNKDKLGDRIIYFGSFFPEKG